LWQLEDDCENNTGGATTIVLNVSLRKWLENTEEHKKSSLKYKNVSLRKSIWLKKVLIVCFITFWILFNWTFTFIFLLFIETGGDCEEYNSFAKDFIFEILVLFIFKISFYIVYFWTSKNLFSQIHIKNSLGWATISLSIFWLLVNTGLFRLHISSKSEWIASWW